MKRFTALLLAAALLFALLAGCSSGAVDLTSTEPSGKPVDVPPDAPSSEPVNLSAGGEPDYYEPNGATIAEFGLQLLERSRGGSNTLVSPLSVVCALAMTMNGAEGETLEQMQNTLGMTVNDLNHFLRDYMANLPEEETYKLSLANSIWFRDDESFEVEQDFLDRNEEFYSAQLYQAAFDSSTVKEINGWVDEHTDGMIKEIIGEISPQTMMYLINALAFDAEWQSIYHEYQVREGVFTREDGVQNDVELMYSSEDLYLEDEYATGFIKYYDDAKYAFVALLPNEGVSVEAYVEWLNGDHVSYLLRNAQEHEVNAAIPKFESEFSVGLGGVLQEMGMVDAFSGSLADFSGIGSYEDENLYIGEVLHKTFIEVDERGTKAGAVTAVITELTGAIMEPVEPKTVYLDRPFVYMLVDREENLPFFIGTAESIGEPNGDTVDPLVDDGLTLDEGALCGYPTVDNFAEGEWQTVETRAEYPDGVVAMSIDLPADWECEEITDDNEDTSIEFGFAVRPKDRSGSINFYCYDMFGVCGTGLSEEKVTFEQSGLSAFVGYYDGSEIWTFAAYDTGSEEFDFVAMNNGMTEWYRDYEDVIWEILGRAKFEVFPGE